VKVVSTVFNFKLLIKFSEPETKLYAESGANKFPIADFVYSSLIKFWNSRSYLFA
jgi:hypothetical protein